MRAGLGVGVGGYAWASLGRYGQRWAGLDGLD